jgi:membrane protease YdiL (CAAX protease family)
MIDNQRLGDTSCRNCGELFNQNEPDHTELCVRCRGLEPGPGLTLEGEGRPGDGRELRDIGIIAGPLRDAAVSSGSEGSGDAHSAESYRSGAGAEADPAHEARRSEGTTALADAYGGRIDLGVGAPVPVEPYNPDRPPWGIAGGVGVWLFSVLAIILIPTLAVGGWLGYEKIKNPDLSMRADDLTHMLLSPPAVLVNVLALFGAHIITLGVVWIIVTRFGRYPFFSTLGWRWVTRPGFPKFWFVIGVVFAMWIIEVALSLAIRQSHETDFERLLKTSQQVRIAVAVLAVLSAPLVEEAVYRGVLFSALISRAGLKWTVALVTLLFAVVHYPQYWGAWSGLAGITVLSLTLTLIRAKTKSILPCVAVHLLFNSLGAIEIVLHKS